MLACQCPPPQQPCLGSMRTCICALSQIHMRTCICTRRCMCACARARARACTHKHVHMLVPSVQLLRRSTPMRTQAHTCTHAHTCIHNTRTLHKQQEKAHLFIRDLNTPGAVAELAIRAPPPRQHLVFVTRLLGRHYDHLCAHVEGARCVPPSASVYRSVFTTSVFTTSVFRCVPPSAYVYRLLKGPCCIS